MSKGVLQVLWLKFLWKVFKKVCSGKIRIAILKNFLFDIISVQNSEKQRYFPQTKIPKKSKSDKKTKFSRKKTLRKISKANKVFSRIVVPTYYKDVTSTTWNSPKQNHTHIYSVLNFWYENMYQFLKSFSLSNDWVYVCWILFRSIDMANKNILVLYRCLARKKFFEICAVRKLQISIWVLSMSTSS